MTELPSLDEIKAALERSWPEAATALERAQEQVDKAEREAVTWQRMRNRHVAEAEARAESLERRAEQLHDRASREPLDLDISDFSDEYCAGFLAGQEHALGELLMGDAALAQPPEPEALDTRTTAKRSSPKNAGLTPAQEEGEAT